eukprot:767407-Hanusia_phi.AAC.1
MTKVLCQVLRQVLRGSSKGWDHVVPGMIRLSFLLLETHSKKASNENLGASTIALSKVMSHKLTIFSISLLERCFRLQVTARDEIISQIFARILLRDDCVKYYVNVLEKIVKHCTKDVIDCLPKTAIPLIRSLEPILNLQDGLQDYLIIILRKCLFSKEIETRTVGLLAFVHIAETCKNQAADSYVNVEVDLIAQLRRCASHQVSIREKLYDGLGNIIRVKPHLLEDVTSFVLSQIQRYYKSAPEGVSLQLENCIDSETGVIKESIPQMLRLASSCIYSQLKKSLGQDTGVSLQSETFSQAKTIMDKILNWILESDLEDFDIDKNTDFTSPKHLSMAKIVIDLNEVLLEHVLICTKINTTELDEKVFKGFSRIQDLLKLLQEQAKSNRNRKQMGQNQESSSTMLSHEFIANLLFSNDKGVGECDFQSDLASKIFNNASIVSYAIESANKLIEMLKSELANDTNVNMKFNQIAKGLLRQFFANFTSQRMYPYEPTGAKRTQQSSLRKLSVQALNGLCNLIQYACCKLDKASIGQMCTYLCEEFSHWDDKSMKIGSSYDESSIKNGIEGFQNIFQMLSTEDDTEHVEYVRWVDNLCKHQDSNRVSGGKAVKRLTDLLLRVSWAQQGLETALRLANDLHILHRDEEQEEETECAPQSLELIIPRQANCDDVEWVLSFLDASYRPDLFDDDEVKDIPENIALRKDHNEMEDEVCERLHRIVEILLHLSDCFTIPTSAQEMILGALTRMYRTADLIAKRIVTSKIQFPRK